MKQQIYSLSSQLLLVVVSCLVNLQKHEKVEVVVRKTKVLLVTTSSSTTTTTTTYFRRWDVVPPPQSQTLAFPFSAQAQGAAGDSLHPCPSPHPFWANQKGRRRTWFQKHFPEKSCEQICRATQAKRAPGLRIKDKSEIKKRTHETKPMSFFFI